MKSLKGPGLYLELSDERGGVICMILTLESLWRHWLKSSRIFLFSYRKATEARCVTGSLCMEALRGHWVTPGLHRRPQDVGEARVVRHLPRGAEDSIWNQPKREKGGVGLSTPFDIRHGDTGYGDYPAAF